MCILRILLKYVPYQKKKTDAGLPVFGFTLVELLIVIGIFAVLSAAVVVIIQPAERFKEARDSTRIQDMNNLDKVIRMFETQNPEVFEGMSGTVVYVSIPDSSATCDNLGLPDIAPYTYACATEENYRNINGTGWIPVNFQASATEVASFNILPVDPINATSTGQYYTFITGGSYEITALMEAKKEQPSAIDDGGMLPGVLQKGTHVGLTPATRDKGLVGYWTFDDGIGIIARDQSVGGNIVNLYNTPTWQTGASCMEGGCLAFNGVNEYGAIANTSANFSRMNFSKEDSFSINVWVNINTCSTVDKDEMGIFGKRYSWAMNMYFPTGHCDWSKRFIAGVRNGSVMAVPISTSLVSYDVWYMVTYTYDGPNDMTHLYVNGVLEKTESAASIVNWDNSDHIYFGQPEAVIWGASVYLDGTLDDVRVYNRALTDREIKSIYDAINT